MPFRTFIHCLQRNLQTGKLKTNNVLFKTGLLVAGMALGMFTEKTFLLVIAFNNELNVGEM
jgi:hypothetical protein